MCGKGSNTQRSVQRTQADPVALAAYQDLFGRAQDVADTAYNPATQQQVAGFTDQQNQGFAATGAMQGAWAPYMAQSANLASLGSAPITASTIQQYMDPYISSVIDATQRDFNVQNARQLSQVSGNARMSGALGGDREAVARALTAEAQNRTQAPIIAQLQSQGYNTALGAAQADAARALQGSSLYSSLGGLAQQYGYNDVNALLQSGALQQGQQQRVLDAATANALAESGYPFQTTQWLAGIEGAIGPAMGSRSTGIQQGPTPNGFSQALGAGLSILSSLATGGRVDDPEAGGERRGYAIGGAPSGGSLQGTGLPYATNTYVPAIPLSVGQVLGMGQNSMGHGESGSSGGGGGSGGSSSDPMAAYKQIMETQKVFNQAGGNLSKGWESLMSGVTATPSAGGWTTSVVPQSAAGMGNFLSNGLSGAGSMLSGAGSGIASGLSSAGSGLAAGASGIMEGIGGLLAMLNTGGRVDGRADVRRGFAAGGDVDVLPYDTMFIGGDGRPMFDDKAAVSGFLRSPVPRSEALPPLPAGDVGGGVSRMARPEFSDASSQPSGALLPPIEDRRVADRRLPGVDYASLPPPDPDSVMSSGDRGATAMTAAAPVVPARSGLASAPVVPSGGRPQSYDGSSGFLGLGDFSKSLNGWLGPQGSPLRQGLLAAGLGMMAGKAGGKGSFFTNVGEGGAAGLNAYRQAQEMDIKHRNLQRQMDLAVAQERRMQAQADLAQRKLNPLFGMEDRRRALAAAGVDPNSAEGRRFLLQGDLGSSHQTQFGKSPIWGVDASGNPAIVQINDAGQAVQTALPPGVKIGKDPVKMDAGTHYVLLDPVTRQTIGVVPKNVAEKEAQEEIGKARGKAIVDVPRQIDNATTSLQTIDKILAHPGRELATGAGGIVPGIPGTVQHDFVSLVDQLKGRAFLDAFNSLRGGGQITEVEGQKATDAIGRLSRSQSKQGFVDAMRDLQDVLRTGLTRAKEQAGMPRGTVGNPIPVRTPEQASQLPAGTYFITPDNQTRQRQ